jgi:hypothetical protein
MRARTAPRAIWGGVIAFVLFGSGIATATASSPAEGAAKTSAIDADAMAALDRMGAELRSHQLLSIRSNFTAEDVLGSGQKLQYGGTLQILVRRPDRFRISAVSDQQDREIYYDGKSVSVFSPRLGYYASFDAPATIYETVEKASADYGIELPLADLFTWGSDKSDAAKINSAFIVGPEHIGSQLCNHYAFRQTDVDWEVWIQRSGPALPCRLVITKRDDPSKPQYSATLQFSFPGSISDSTFVFAPPSNAHKIAFVGAAARAP